MKSCFGYIRVSTQKQGEGVSLAAQKEAILGFASSRGFIVSEWFEEKETAAKSGRPVFNRMLRELKRGRASGLIIQKIDRSARNLKDWAIISELPDIGVDVFIATETLDFRSRGGRLTADIQAVIAADFIRNLREETIKGLTGRLKQGLYPFRAPIGYLDNGRGQSKTICPIKGPLVRKAFELYAGGGHSLRTLQATMIELGLTNQVGKPLSLHGIETMMGNSFYCGIITIRRTGLAYEGIHQPIIDARTFKRVQDIRAGRAGKKVTRHDHLYRGLFRCGLCDRPMSPEKQKGHVYYRCHDLECATKTIREECLERAISAKLNKLMLTPKDADTLRTRFIEWLKSDERRGNFASIELRITKANQRLDRLTDLLVDGNLDQRQFEERKTALLLERSLLEKELVKMRENELFADKLEKFIELMKNLAEFHILLNPGEKRSLLKNLFSNRTVTANNVELEPYDWVADRDFIDLSPLVTHVDTLIELSPKNEDDNHPRRFPQWKRNLQHQLQDDLPEAL